MRTTDMADELFRGPETELPAGVRLATAKRGGVTVTRVEIAREPSCGPCCRRKARCWCWASATGG